MCGPVLLAATTGFQMLSGFMQGQQQKAVGEYNAKVSAANAASQDQLGIAQEGQQRERSAAVLSDQLASEAASGFVASTGTPLAVARASARNAEIDALTVRMQSNMRADQFRQDSAISSAEARAANTASYLSVGSSLLRGAGDAYKLGYIG